MQRNQSLLSPVSACDSILCRVAYNHQDVVSRQNQQRRATYVPRVHLCDCYRCL